VNAVKPRQCHLCLGPLRAWVVVGLTMFASLVWINPASAVIHLQLGDDAPQVQLPDKAGKTVDTDSMRGRTVVLIFGELYHSKTLRACAQVKEILADQRFSGEPIDALLIVTRPQAVDPNDGGGVDMSPITVLLDTDRVAFEAYRVAVLPSVVVMDAQGRVVHAIAALTTDFSDRLTDTLLMATGKLSFEQFEARSHPQQDSGLTQDQARARRLTMLAGQLSARGLVALAEQKYTESLELDTGQTAAWVGMGTLKLKRGRLSEAEQQFRNALKQEPGSTEAALGLAFVMTRRGGDELPEAEKLTRHVLATNPSQPRAHYLLGLIREQAGDIEGAADSFKRAAELLLDYYELEPTP
jgi:Flp pilus assembly protein TadD